MGIRVMEFGRAISFYEKLGFTVTRQDSKEHVVVLKHTCGIEINLLDSGDDENERRNVLMDVDMKYPGYTHYAIQVDSANEAKLFLEHLGLTVTEGSVTLGMARHRYSFATRTETSLNLLSYKEPET